MTKAARATVAVKGGTTSPRQPVGCHCLVLGVRSSRKPWEGVKQSQRSDSDGQRFIPGQGLSATQAPEKANRATSPQQKGCLTSIVPSVSSFRLRIQVFKNTGQIFF